MKGQMLTETKFRTPEFRVSFPHLFEAHTVQEGDKPSYSVQMIFDRDTKLTVFKKAVKAVQKSKFQDKKIKSEKIKHVRDGNEIENSDGEIRPETKDKWVIQVASKNRRPRVLNARREDIINPDEIYGGCYAVAVIEAYGYDNQYGRGISFGLLGVQKTRDGEPFVGGVSTDDFEDIEFEDAEDDDSEGPY